MADMDLRQLIRKEAAKNHFQVHDEVKDKMFELELSKGWESHRGRPQEGARRGPGRGEKFKSALEEDSDSDEDMG